MKILAVASESFELLAWAELCAPYQGLGWPVDFSRRFQCDEHEIHAIANGPGPRLTLQALDAALTSGTRFDCLLSVGLCGALDPALPLFSLCTASSVSDGRSEFPAVPLSGAAPVRVLSIDKFLGDPPEKARYFAQGFGIVEMEAAAVASRAAALGLPFHAVKIVSDLAVERFDLDFNQFRDADGRFVRKRIALAALRHPFRFYPSLSRFLSRGGNAARKLGDYLANARF